SPGVPSSVVLLGCLAQTFSSSGKERMVGMAGVSKCVVTRQHGRDERPERVGPGAQCANHECRRSPLVLADIRVAIPGELDDPPRTCRSCRKLLMVNDFRL